MKHYTIAQLKTIAKQQGYKLAALETLQGDRKQMFNNIKKTSLDKQLDLITNRLKSELFPDGVYNVLMAQTINSAKNADKYPVVKGEIKNEVLTETSIEIIPKQENVLTYAAAIEMNRDLANLRAENTSLKKEILDLQLQIEDLLDDDDDESLSSAPVQNDTLDFFKNTLAGLAPLADEYFKLQNKKLSLEEMKINQRKNIIKKQQIKKVPIEVGTQNHLNVIEHYFKTNNDEKLNIELDKLEEHDPELYKTVCEKLGMDPNDQGEGGSNE